MSIHEAASDGDIRAIEWLVGRAADVNAKNNNGDTPLHLAAYYGYVPAMELLVGRGANVNARNKDGWLFGKTPLKIAIEQNETEAADWLRAHGGK
jgi:ankyrin repeat protein